MSEFIVDDCTVCGEPVTQEDGSLFIGEDGGIYCGDHYPEREEH